MLKECVKWSPHGLGGSVKQNMFDMISIHMYSSSAEHCQNVIGMFFRFLL